MNHKFIFGNKYNKNIHGGCQLKEWNIKEINSQEYLFFKTETVVMGENYFLDEFISDSIVLIHPMSNCLAENRLTESRALSWIQLRASDDVLVSMCAIHAAYLKNNSHSGYSRIELGFLTIIE